jgi:hypothetical protein
MATTHSVYPSLEGLPSAPPVLGDLPMYPRLDAYTPSSYPTLSTISSCDEFVNQYFSPLAGPPVASAPFLGMLFRLPKPANPLSADCYKYAGAEFQEPQELSVSKRMARNSFIQWFSAVREIPARLIEQLQLKGKETPSFDPWNPGFSPMGPVIQAITEAVYAKVNTAPLDTQIEVFERAIQDMHHANLPAETRRLVEIALRKTLTLKCIDSWPSRIALSTPIAVPTDFQAALDRLQRFATFDASLLSDVDLTRLLIEPVFKHAINARISSVDPLATKIATARGLMSEVERAISTADPALSSSLQTTLAILFRDQVYHTICDQEAVLIGHHMDAHSGRFPGSLYTALCMLQSFYSDGNHYPTFDPVAVFLEKCLNQSSIFSRLPLADQIVRLEESLAEIDPSGADKALVQQYLRGYLTQYLLEKEQRCLVETEKRTGFVDPSIVVEKEAHLTGFATKSATLPLSYSMIEALLSPIFSSKIEKEVSKWPVLLSTADRVERAERCIQSLSEAYGRQFPRQNSVAIVNQFRRAWTYELYKNWNCTHIDQRILQAFRTTGQMPQEFYEEARQLDSFASNHGTLAAPFCFLTSKLYGVFGDAEAVHAASTQSFYATIAYERIGRETPALAPTIPGKLALLEKQRESLRWVASMLSPTATEITPPPGTIVRAIVEPPKPSEMVGVSVVPPPALDETVRASHRLIEDAVETGLPPPSTSAPLGKRDVEVDAALDVVDETASTSRSSAIPRRIDERADERALALSRLVIMQQMSERARANAAFAPKRSCNGMEVVLGDRAPSSKEALDRNKLVKFLAFGNFLTDRPCALSTMAMELTRDKLRATPVLGLFAKRDDKELVKTILPKLVEQVRFDDPQKTKALALLLRYYHESPFYDIRMEDDLRADFASDGKFLGHVYEQAIAEGIKIEAWDRQWAEYNWHKNIPRCVQALHRYLLA